MDAVALDKAQFETFHDAIYGASAHRWADAPHEPYLALFFTKFVPDGEDEDGNAKTRQMRKTVIHEWDDVNGMWKTIKRYNGDQSYNAYISANPLRERPAKPGSRGKDADYLCRIVLPTDFDLNTGVHAGAGLSMEEYSAALDAMRKIVGDPDLLVNTGGGRHGWWLIDDSIDDSHADRWRAWTRSLGSDSVADLPRVLRVPGSLNVKGDPKPVLVLDPEGY